MRVVVRRQEFTPVVKIPESRQAFELAAADLRVHLDQEDLKQYFQGLDMALGHFQTAFNFAEVPRYRNCERGDVHNGVANMINAAEDLRQILASIEGIEPLATFNKVRTDITNLEYQAGRVFADALFENCPCGGKRP